MNANHLIVGLGGTGGKVIRAFRKPIYQEFRKTSTSDANLDYLYVDSSGEMMAIDDPSWKILGTSVQHFLGWMVSAFSSRQDLVLENLALRRQLLALHAQRPRR